jgi:hypothetical protein
MPKRILVTERIIENSALAKDGKITMIADATVIRIDKVLMT